VVETIQQAVTRYGYTKVLVTAPSNVAVDNVLARLVAGTAAPKRYVRQQSKQQHQSQKTPPPRLKVVRLGHPARLQANILPYSLEGMFRC
jgi:tRNA(Met) C34 N-acetyltransferase TmcA